MSDLYLLIANEQRGPYSESQVRTMYNSGSITSDTHYWQEGQDEWLPIDTLFCPQTAEQPSASLPTATFSTVKPHKPINRPFVIVAILVGIIGSIVIGVYLFNKHQEETAKQQRQIPIEIMHAINNVSSATSTGVNLETYTNLVIALKSAVATYGQKLPSDEGNLLNKIVYNYDIGIQLWEKAQTAEDGESIIVLNIASDYQLDREIKNLNVSPCIDIISNSADDQHNQYSRGNVLSALWTLNDVAIKELCKNNK